MTWHSNCINLNRTKLILDNFSLVPRSQINWFKTSWHLCLYKLLHKWLGPLSWSWLDNFKWTCYLLGDSYWLPTIPNNIRWSRLFAHQLLATFLWMPTSLISKMHIDCQLSHISLHQVLSLLHKYLQWYFNKIACNYLRIHLPGTDNHHIRVKVRWNFESNWSC